MNLVNELQEALERAGFRPTVTYSEDDDYFPTVHVGEEWEVGVDGSCLNVGLGPYAVNHPQDEEGAYFMSPPLMKPADVVEYLKVQGVCP